MFNLRFAQVLILLNVLKSGHLLKISILQLFGFGSFEHQNSVQIETCSP